MRQAAIYCRVSTHDQSCERQERDLISFAQRGDYEVVKIFKETGSGARNDRIERKKVMVLAQRREISAILVTELSRWGRSTPDLLDTLGQLQGWGVSVIAQTGLECDFNTPQGKLMTTIIAGFAEFERDLLRERIMSGLANARARGKLLGRQVGERVKSDRYESRVLALVAEKRPYRLIAKDLGLSKTTVVEIVKRSREGEEK